MTSRFAAIILAAGFSSRMGIFKPLLPLGGITLLERNLELFKSINIKDIQVVVGYRGNELIPLLEKFQVFPVVNSHYMEGMFSSVMAGIDNLNEGCQAFYLLPVDIPLVRRQTLIDLAQAYINDKEQIIYPVFHGKRGHPPLISTCFLDRIKSWRKDGGLRAFLMEHSACAVEVEVTDEYILCDVDTPDDYQKILDAWKRYEIPSIRECETMFRRFSIDSRICAHSRKVADMALCIGKELNRAGCFLDLSTIEAACLLHDIAKGKKNHAAEGGKILRRMGYASIAKVVESHVDIMVQNKWPIIENEVVYLADKLVEGEMFISLENRFKSNLEKYADNVHVKERISQRFENALVIQKRIEKILERPLKTILLKNES